MYLDQYRMCCIVLGEVLGGDPAAAGSSACGSRFVLLSTLRLRRRRCRSVINVMMDFK